MFAHGQGPRLGAFIAFLLGVKHLTANLKIFERGAVHTIAVEIHLAPIGRLDKTIALGWK